jgi:transmembrane sensor
MSTGDARVRDLITEEAAEWFLANRQELDEAKRSQFLSWLKESPVHVEEYLGVIQITHDLRHAFNETEFSTDALLERAKAENSAERVVPFQPRVTPSQGTRSAFRWGFTAVATALGAAVIAVFYLWPRTMPVVPEPEKVSVVTFATRHGELLTQRLDDASIIHLNTDTTVVVRYSRGERRAVLGRGQAIFEVVHDPARPFHVTAGSAEIADVGTTFDVYLRPDSTLITVLDGRVNVSSLPTVTLPQRLGSEHLHGEPMQVTAGQQVRVVPGQAPTLPTRVDAQRSSAWLQRQMSFKKEPLAEVAAEFNRYSATPIEIVAPSLQRLPISGVFRTDDTESFLAFLRTLDGVRVTVTPTRIQVDGP